MCSSGGNVVKVEEDVPARLELMMAVGGQASTDDELRSPVNWSLVGGKYAARLCYHFMKLPSK